MRYYILLLVLPIANFHLAAQTPLNRQTGIGIILGDPTGITVKTTWNKQIDFTTSVGPSYFGALRVNADWTWNFDVFRSSAVHLYFGPGAVLGIGSASGIVYTSKRGVFYYRANNEVGLGVRGIVGVCGIIKNEPLEFFLEIGPLVGLVPAIGSSVDLGIGMRFYP